KLQWCRGGDSNSYSLFGHSALNAACLPIPPPRLDKVPPTTTTVAENYSYGGIGCL
ncbi:uncharacterized protein METZ01_LOCUS244011, partial [marine metagenome]